MTSIRKLLLWSPMIIVLMSTLVVKFEKTSVYAVKMNPRIQQKYLESRVVGSNPVIAVARNSTRMTVRAIPENIHFQTEASESVSVRCRVKCIVTKVQDLPTVSFYFQIADETILPLSSGMPGVDIYTSASQSRKQRPYQDKDDSRAVITYRSDTHLTLDSAAFTFLRPGHNSFFCRAYSPSTGIQKSHRFTVHIPSIRATPLRFS